MENGPALDLHKTEVEFFPGVAPKEKQFISRKALEDIGKHLENIEKEIRDASKIGLDTEGNVYYVYKYKKSGSLIQVAYKHPNLDGNLEWKVVFIQPYKMSDEYYNPGDTDYLKTAIKKFLLFLLSDVIMEKTMIWGSEY